MVDYAAIERVLGTDVAERFGLASEEMNDLADAPGMLCMAYERSHNTLGLSMGEAMTQLLDEWDAQ
jgi:hypothetical protein